MAGTTPVYGLRYAELVDPPDGAALGKNLADDVEAELERVDAAAAALDARTDELELDTGRRDITSLAGAGFRTSFPNSRVYVRRIRDVVYVTVSLADGAGGSAVTVMEQSSDVFPEGFREPETITGGRWQGVGMTFNNNNGGIGGAQLLVTPVTFATDLALYGLAAGVTAYAQIVFTTTEPWPAVLPGVAA